MLVMASDTLIAILAGPLVEGHMDMSTSRLDPWQM